MLRSQNLLVLIKNIFC